MSSLLASREATFRTGLMAQGFATGDFRVKYLAPSRATRPFGASPEAVQVRVCRMSARRDRTYLAESDWAAAALQDLGNGLFGTDQA
jgi:hypothetical protein